MHNIIFIVFTGICSIGLALVIGGIIYRKRAGICRCPNKLNGKTVIITGSSAGIGKEAAKELAVRGARVILACRNLEKAEKVKEWVVAESGNDNVVARQLDVSDLDSVRMFSEQILKQEERLDILINNAGIMTHEKSESKQGFELTAATNHLGPFLLTNLLLELIKRSSPSRIINVSSSAHAWFNLDFEDFHFKKTKYSGFDSYNRSKLCNLLFTKELSHLLTGKEVTVNALHPGLVKTELFNKAYNFRNLIFSVIFLIVGKSANVGAQTIVHLAISDEAEMVTGEYFADCRIEKHSKKASDPGLAKKLWEFTEDEVGLRENERHYL